METILACALVLSIAFNAFQVYLARKAIKSKQRAHDITAQELLHDLTRRGSAILRIEVVDPSNFLLRSPRD